MTVVMLKTRRMIEQKMMCSTSSSLQRINTTTHTLNHEVMGFAQEKLIMGFNCIRLIQMVYATLREGELIKRDGPLMRMVMGCECVCESVQEIAGWVSALLSQVTVEQDRLVEDYSGEKVDMKVLDKQTTNHREFYMIMEANDGVKHSFADL